MTDIYVIVLQNRNFIYNRILYTKYYQGKFFILKNSYNGSVLLHYSIKVKIFNINNIINRNINNKY